MKKYFVFWLLFVVGSNFVFSQKPPQPQLVSPLDGSIVQITTPTMDWEDIDDADSYTIAIYTDEFCRIKVLKKTDVSPPYKVPSGYLEKGNTYFWRVAVQKGNRWSVPSQLWSFTIAEENINDLESERKIICPNCGNKNKPTAKYCAFCGGQLQNSGDYAPAREEQIEPSQMQTSSNPSSLVKDTIPTKDEILRRTNFQIYWILQSVKMDRVNEYIKALFSGITKTDELTEIYGWGGAFKLKLSETYSIKPYIESIKGGTNFDFEYGSYYNKGYMDITVKGILVGGELLLESGDKKSSFYLGGGPVSVSGNYEEQITIGSLVYNDTCKGSAIGFTLKGGWEGYLDEKASIGGFINLGYLFANIEDLTNPYGQKVLLTTNVPFELNFSGPTLDIGLVFSF
ncbi:MAG: zinc ribbon domain-containing protein [Elusimicrobiota bacterium]